MWIAGLDGCRHGWVGVLRNPDVAELRCRVARSIAEIDDWPESPEIVGIDVPIGLLDAAMRGGRSCDRLARALLGPLRGRSVFSAPARATLLARDYDDALRRNRSSSPHAIGISRQCFAILPKIREVDRYVTRAPRRRVVEVHPEVSFAVMNDDVAIVATKKSDSGRRSRLDLLGRRWSPLASTLADRTPRQCAPDDLVDAMAACWSAERVAFGTALGLPEDLDLDGVGLRMQIVA